MPTEDIKRRRSEFLAACPLPKDRVEVMAQLVLSVIKHPEGMETIDWEIARELTSKGFRR
jgi:hypothetical protein